MAEKVGNYLLFRDTLNSGKLGRAHTRARVTDSDDMRGRFVGEVNDASRPGHQSLVLWERANRNVAHRRLVLHLAAGAAALSTLQHVARAQTYPTRPVTLIVGFGCTPYGAVAVG